MRPGRSIAVIVGVVALQLSGCVNIGSYPTIEPLTYRPDLQAPQDPVPVDSLTPTFRWRQPDPEARADFAIWNVGSGGQPGEIAYHAENLAGGTHTLAAPLMPGTEYFWSVRRAGTNDWAKLKYREWYLAPPPIGGLTVPKRVLFKIRTPPVEKAAGAEPGRFRGAAPDQPAP